MASEIESLKTEFLEYLEIEKNRSTKTVANYDFYLNRFFAETGIKRASDITLPKVKKFRLFLNRLENPNRADSDGLAKSTQNYHMIALRSFLKYLAKVDVEVLAAEKIELAKEPDREVAFLEVDELERLLETPLLNKHGIKVEKPGILRLRDKAILELLFSTGLRVSECANLRRDSVNLKKDEFTVMGKGSKLRIVFLTDSARKGIEAYLKERDLRMDTSPYLFASHDRASKARNDDAKPLTSRSIQRMIQKYTKAAGITKKVTPHTIRHTFATDLLQNGADIRSVQSMLGHASITTTQVYTHITNKRLRETHKKYHSKK